MRPAPTLRLNCRFTWRVRAEPGLRLLQAQRDVAIARFAQTILRQRWPPQVSAQGFQPFAIVRRDPNIRVQIETFELGAPLSQSPPPASVPPSPTHPSNALSSPNAGCNPLPQRCLRDG